LIDNSQVRLRPQTNDDKDFLQHLYISTRVADLKQLGWAPAEMQAFLSQQHEIQYLSYRNQYRDAEFQIIEYQAELVGRLYLHRGSDEYRIIDISLLAEFRNRQLGRYLIQNIQDCATTSSIPVSLHVEKTSPAIRLYQHLGFEKKEDRGIHWLMQWESFRSAELDR
jgi:ribosomal protein S18 acetylase RimI-like enzyme|tara:strand:+ start:970 stop:1470 length:501 start_codon:yes stop_codon:yes gene_type:complete